MGLENTLISNRIIPRREVFRRALGAATFVAAAYLIGNSETVQAAPPTKTLPPGGIGCAIYAKRPVSREQAEKAIGMKMSTLHNYYEEYISCERSFEGALVATAAITDIRLKPGLPEIPTILYPGILRGFPSAWSEESREMLYELAGRMPGYYTPAHLPKPAWLVLSTLDAVNVAQEPYWQPVVTFRPKTMSYRDPRNAVRIFIHEGAHLEDPMTVVRSAGLNSPFVTCMREDYGDIPREACSDDEKKSAENNLHPIIVSPLHKEIYKIFPGSSYLNPPPVMKEWADREFDELRKAGRLGGGGSYDTIERLVYGIKRNFPVELIGVFTEFMVQGSDFLMEAAKPLIGIGVFKEDQIVGMRSLMLNEGPLKGRSLKELNCFFN